MLLNSGEERTQENNDLMDCMASIDWSTVKQGRAGDNMEQGRLLAIKTFTVIDWSQQSGSSASILSQVMKMVPQDIEYQQIVQGFTDELTSELLKASMSKKSMAGA